MVTDVAPYSSILQRFGRLNRYGETEGEIFWVDRPLNAKRASWATVAHLDYKQRQEVFAPYDAREVDACVDVLSALKSAAPADLPPIKSLVPWRHVIRRADLLDLFDTTPDLAGNEIDIPIRPARERHGCIRRLEKLARR